MSVSVDANCDGCGKDCEDECYCSNCAKAEPDIGGSDRVGDLAAAIRRGDTSEAEYLLDGIAAEIPGWSDRVSIGRYSPRARSA